LEVKCGDGDMDEDEDEDDDNEGEQMVEPESRT